MAHAVLVRLVFPTDFEMGRCSQGSRPAVSVVTHTGRQTHRHTKLTNVTENE